MLNPKQFLLLILLLVVNSANCQYFAPVGAKWFYNTDPFMSPSYIGYHLFEAEKDTILSGLNCTKIVHSSHYSLGTDYNYLPEFVRYENKRVYYYKYNQFRLLYDFNLELGDTLHFFNPEASAWDADTMTHLAVDTIIQVEQNGVKYKTYYFKDDPFAKWYLRNGVAELIGGTYWLFPSLTIGIDSEPGGLRCYQDSAVYINLSPGDSTACDYTWTNPIFSGTEELSLDIGFKIYPNPISSVSRFVFPNPKEQNHFLLIYNSLGQCIKQLETKEHYFELYEIDFANGLYQYVLLDSQQQIVKRDKFLSF